MTRTSTILRMGNVWTFPEGDRSAIDVVLDQIEEPLEGGYGLRSVNGGFASGIAQIMAESLKVPLIDERTIPCTSKELPPYLRNYQNAAVAAGIEKTRGLIKVPTGGGKTIIATGFAAALPCRWLYVVHRSNLVEQTAHKMQQLLNEEIGEFRGGRKSTKHRVVCATYQSLISPGNPEGGRLLLEAEGLLVDEAHRAPGLTTSRTIARAYNAYWRLGLSATPLLRGDEQNVRTVGLLGPVIYEIPAKTLVEQGHIVPPRVIWTVLRQTSGFQDWHDFYRSTIVFSEARNAALLEIARRAPTPAIIFVKERLHGEILTKRLASLPDYRVEWINGHTPAAVRHAAIARLRGGQTKAIVASSVFYEGVDAPEIRSVIIASAGRSFIEAIQRLGRGTRPDGTKVTFDLYDFADYGHRWLENHTRERYEAYVEAGYTVTPLPTDTPSVRSIDITDVAAYDAANAMPPVVKWILAGFAVLCVLILCLGRR